MTAGPRAAHLLPTGKGAPSAILAAVAGFLLMAGCGSAPDPTPNAATPATLDRVAQTKELRACSTGDYRPLTYRDPDGQWSGIDIDMARDLATELGAQLTIVPTTWSNLLGDLTAGRCDIAVGGVSVTPERAAAAAFTDPYLSDGKTPITRCENVAKYQTIEQIDRPEVRVVVNPGGTNEKFARDSLPHATVVPYPDNNTIFDAVVDGRADLMVTDAIETRWQATRNPALCAVHPDAPFNSSEKAYLVQQGDQPFLDRVNTWLHGAMSDGTYQRIAEPWIG